jgi:outer membrane protein TolC
MKYLIIIFAILFTINGNSQESLSLPQAISIGLENNFAIKIAENNIQIAENNNTWARAGRTPTIDLNGTFNNSINKDNNPASFINGSYYSGAVGATINAEWILFSGGRVRIAKEQLNTSVSQQQLYKDVKIHDLIKDITQQYNNILFQQEQLNVIQTVMKLSNDKLDYEMTKKEFGNSNTFNLLQFENAVYADSSNYLNQIQNIEISKRTLYNTLKLNGLKDYVFLDKLSVVKEKIEKSKLKSILSEENYTIKTLNIVNQLNQLNTRLEKSFNSPTVGITAGGGFTENGLRLNVPGSELRLGNRLNGNINAFANWNLYDGNVQDVNIQNAKIREQIGQLDLIEAQVMLNNQLEILISNYENQESMLDLSIRQLEIASKNIEITEERFKSGQISSLDYRNIQTQYLNAAFNKVSAIYNLIITKSEIDYLVGVFDVD